MKYLKKFISSEFSQLSGIANNITALLGWLSDRKLPSPILKLIIKTYISSNNIDLSEYNDGLSNYKTFNQFFTRSFRPDVRPFSNNISSPAEGVLTAAGNFHSGNLFHVKNSNYHLSDLLEKQGFLSGSFATIYLSPADYHRVHSPFDCTIRAIKHIGGMCRTVNPSSIAKIPNLYCKNERVVIEGTSSLGNFYIVLVGAVVVGRIKLKIVEDFKNGYEKDNLIISLQKGDEIGLFELGSTVILVLEENYLANTKPEVGSHVKLGVPLC